MSTQVTGAVVLGVGQLGGVFAHGFLRCGRPVWPLLRETDPGVLLGQVDPEVVLVAVGEDALRPALDGVPDPWRSRVALVQNELLPDVWRGAGIDRPTVAVVWFEKKRGTGIKPILPTPIAGPRAAFLCEALAAVGVPARAIEEGPTLVESLVAKNLFVIASNVAGLAGEGETVGALLDSSRFRDIGEAILDVQEARAGSPLDRPRIWETVHQAIAADPSHGARGRSAPARLARALADADRAGLPVPALREIARAATPGG